MTNSCEESSVFEELSKIEIKEALARGSIAAMIANKRRQLNISQEKLAKEIGVSSATISSWESLNRSPTFKNLFKVMDILGVDVEIHLNGRNITETAKQDECDIQKEEIDKLKTERMYYMDKYHELAKTEERMWQEATEYFAEELKQRIKNQPKWQCMARGDRQAYGFSCDEIMRTVDEVLKEMTEVGNG